MDKKELLKRWALAYTEPSLFYIPWRKKELKKFKVTFHRYSNVITNTYQDTDSWYIGKESLSLTNRSAPQFYIYDRQGYYYAFNGTKSKDIRYLLSTSSIYLPNGTYYYKEMRSLLGCKLLTDIITFTVNNSDTIVETHHNANMVRVDYHIEGYTWLRNEILETEQIETEEKRLFHPVGRRYSYWLESDGEIIYRSNVYEGLEIPVVIIDDVYIDTTKYNKPFSINEKIEPKITTNRNYLLSSQYGGKYLNPFVDIFGSGAWEATYPKTEIYVQKDKWNDISYAYKCDKQEYSFTRNYLSYLGDYTKYGYDLHETHYSAIIYNIDTGEMEIREEQGNEGREPYEIKWGKTSLMLNWIYDTPYRKNIIAEFAIDENKEWYITEIISESEEQPHTTVSSPIYHENFNQVSMISEMLSVLAQNENIPLCKTFMYKIKNGDVSCYFASFTSGDMYETHYLKYGNTMTNNEADEVYIGALIQYEKRDEDSSGGET